MSFPYCLCARHYLYYNPAKIVIVIYFGWKPRATGARIFREIFDVWRNAAFAVEYFNKNTLEKGGRCR